MMRNESTKKIRFRSQEIKRLYSFEKYLFETLRYGLSVHRNITVLIIHSKDWWGVGATQPRSTLILHQSKTRKTRTVSSRAVHFTTSSHIFLLIPLKQTLSIVVVGASGDLAKKKTYPSLLNLFEDNLLPEHTVIWGYARSAKSHKELRDHLYPHLIKTGACERVVKDFLAKCFYHSGKSYGDEEAYLYMVENISKFEKQSPSAACNRIFYLAIPPNVFGESGVAIKKVGMVTTGWTRVIIEKPFGRDLDTCNELLKQLSSQFDEEHLYRIDHYLGKVRVRGQS
jgi:hypothetical protein